MVVPLLDVAAQKIALDAELQDAFTRVLHSGHYILGDEVSSFENETAARCGRRTALALLPARMQYCSR